MNRQLETIDGGNWEEFTRDRLGVLVLGKSDCDKCASWCRELTEFLAQDDSFGDVRFGKLLLDQRGLIGYKRASPWLAEVSVLPFNVIYRDGQVAKSFAGGGLERLLNRLRRLAGSESSEGPG
jgi:hypothetical protein